MTARDTQAANGSTDRSSELVDGVHAIAVTLELEDREITVNPAAVETERGILLVDCPGWPSAAGQLEAGLDHAGFGWEDVRAAFVTHQDPDHAGGLAELAERTDPVVFAHRECAPYVDGRDHPIKMDDERYPPARVDVEVTEGVRFHTVAGPADVYHTPGHVPGHASLHFPDEEFLLSGDALHAPDGDLDGPRGPLDEAEAVDAIGKLAELDVSHVLCYHGGYVEEGTDAIAAIRNEKGEPPAGG